MRSHQGGASLLIALVMLAGLVFAALSLARMTETSTLVSGNLSYKSAALQASEVGLSEAYATLQAMSTSEDANQAGWYYASVQPTDAAGLPSGVDWSAVTKKVTVGQYEARYVVERLCTGAMPVTDPENQCFLERVPAAGSAKAGTEAMESPAVKQYRLTVSVTGPKNARTFVQSIATR